MNDIATPPPEWRPATKLVRGGTRRSRFNETSEALFLTSGYVYEDAATAEARFKGELEGFVYSRFGNPTVAALRVMSFPRTMPRDGRSCSARAVWRPKATCTRRAPRWRGPSPRVSTC